MSSLRSLLPIASTALLAIAAGTSVWMESRPFRESGGTALERIEAAGGAPLALGLSSLSQDLALSECRDVLVDPLNRLLPAETESRLLRTCTATAEDVLARSPASAYAAFVAGYASALDGDAGRAANEFSRSQGLAPAAAWLAQLRLRPLNEGTLPADAAGDEARADIRLLGGLPGGRQWLAGWYARRPEMREMILSAIETLPPENQRDFLDAVRRRAS